MDSYDSATDRRPHHLRLLLILAVLSFSMAACREAVAAAKAALLDGRSARLHGLEVWRVVAAQSG